MASTKKTFALVLGIVLLLVGLAGFFDNGIVGDAGYFGTNTFQDVLHVIAGLCGIYAGTKGMGTGFNATIGWIGLVLGVLGFIPGTNGLLANWFNINAAISGLHIVIGLVCLGVNKWAN